jgi:hypothetical protein
MSALRVSVAEEQVVKAGKRHCASWALVDYRAYEMIGA